MTKRERVQAVLQGGRSDRPPVSCWYHFSREQQRGKPGVDAHLAHLHRYDLDFLKIMNDMPFPRGEVEVVRTTVDLKKLRPLAGDAGHLSEQLEMTREIARQAPPDVPLCVTLFSPWTTLRIMTRPASYDHGLPKLDAHDDRDQTLTALLTEDRSALKAALEAIALTQAAFVRETLSAGAHGIFLSTRDQWVNSPANGPHTYEELARPADLIVLEAARAGSLNILHVCGKPLNLRLFNDYPVHALHWADRAAGPSIAYARDRVKPAIAGGVDNLKTLPEGKPDDVAAEVRDALRQADPRPLIIAPGCTFDPKAVPEENLHAMIAAARAGWHGTTL